MANFDIVKGLKRVRRVVNNGWCKGADARSAKGVAVGLGSTTAKSYDLETACDKAAQGNAGASGVLKNALYDALRAGTSFYSLIEFNDSVATRRSDVLDLIAAALTKVVPAPTVE